MSKIDEKRLWIIEAGDGAWGANGICKGELVRCGECNYAREITGGVRIDGCTIWCNHIGQYTTADWFCADGERRTDADRESTRD